MLLAAETMEAKDMRIEVLEAQIDRVRELLRGQNERLNQMSEDERTAFNFVQTFILDMLDMLDAIDEDGARVVAADEAEGTALGGGRDGGEPNGEACGGSKGGSDSSAKASSSVEPKPLKLSKAEREGALVIEQLTKIYRLENAGKMADAEALRKELPKTKILGTSAVNKVVQDLQARMFSVGGYDTIMKVVEGLFSRPLMKQARIPLFFPTAVRCSPSLHLSLSLSLSPSLSLHLSISISPLSLSLHLFISLSPSLSLSLHLSLSLSHSFSVELDGFVNVLLLSQ
jgi:hypothetical protein